MFVTVAILPHRNNSNDLPDRRTTEQPRCRLVRSALTRGVGVLLQAARRLSNTRPSIRCSSPDAFIACRIVN